MGLKVHMATLRKEDGAVLHECEVPEDVASEWAAASALGVKASCQIDAERRRLAARLHSAGHLLDVAVKAADLHWIPSKGYHFPDGSYVEYAMHDTSVKIDPKKVAEKEKIIKDIQSNIGKLVHSGGVVKTSYVDGMRRVE